ncbi:MAG: hypothetical protein CR993_03945 [Rhodobacterales bacterium]|nr:MAG: hypothetical protein CR993_03945 [Rhodobacterales bacterium]
MHWLIIIGTTISLFGLIGLVLSALRVMRARKSGASDDDLREAMRRAMVLNMGAFAISALGLMVVVVGVILT